MYYKCDAQPKMSYVVKEYQPNSALCILEKCLMSLHIILSSTQEMPHLVGALQVGALQVGTHLMWCALPMHSAPLTRFPPLTPYTPLPLFSSPHSPSLPFSLIPSPALVLSLSLPSLSLCDYHCSIPLSFLYNYTCM